MAEPALNHHLIGEADLMAWLGYERRGDLLRWLRARGVPYDTGKGGCLVTTVEAVNQGLLGQSRDEVEFL